METPLHQCTNLYKFSLSNTDSTTPMHKTFTSSFPCAMVTAQTNAQIFTTSFPYAMGTPLHHAQILTTSFPMQWRLHYTNAQIFTISFTYAMETRLYNCKNLYYKFSLCNGDTNIQLEKSLLQVSIMQCGLHYIQLHKFMQHISWFTLDGSVRRDRNCLLLESWYDVKLVINSP